MRAGLLVLAFAACGPKVTTSPHIVEDDLDLPPAGASDTPTARSAAPTDQRASTAPATPAPPPAQTPQAPRAAPPLPPVSDIADTQRSVAPPGKGLRTGTIARDRLIAVLNAGPGSFLRQFEVAPRLAGDRFLGWQLVQLLDHAGPLTTIDLVSGDVLLAINGNRLSRPDELQTIWDSLRTANELNAHLWRGDAKFDLRFTIEPKVH